MKSRPHFFNALFNLAGGACAGLLILVLPYLLNRVLSQSDYAVWVLGFQAAVYVPMFGLGIHQLLNRAIAYHLAHDEHEYLDRNLASSLAIVIGLSIVAICFVLVGSLFINQITQLNSNQELSIVQVWLTVGGAASLGLMSLFFFGCFGGLQLYEWENIYKSITSIGFLAIIFAALGLGIQVNPLSLAQLYFVVVSLGLLFLLWRFTRQSELRYPSFKNWHLPTTKSFVRDMYSLSIWQIGILMVSGFDLWIVAKLDFSAVPGYSIALSFLVFLSGTIAAIAGPFLPRFAAELRQSNHGQFKAMFLGFQKRLLILCFVIFFLLMLVPDSIWTYLLKESAPVFQEVFIILLIASCLRIITMLYSLAIVAANLQTKVVLSPLMEGGLNLLFSIILGFIYGPIGVAIGTLIGAFVCLLLHSFYNIPRLHKQIPLNRLALIFPWADQ